MQAPKRRLLCKQPTFKPRPPSRSRCLHRIQEPPLVTEPEKHRSTIIKTYRPTEPEKAEKQTKNEIIKKRNSAYRQGTHGGGGELG